MSAHTADSKFSFQLPSLSYIDAKWEEPSLRAPAARSRSTRNTGIAAWLSRRVANFATRLAQREAVIELSSMSDRELQDIGLSRSDVPRVFTPAFNADLRRRGEQF